MQQLEQPNAQLVMLVNPLMMVQPLVHPVLEVTLDVLHALHLVMANAQNALQVML